MKDEFLFQIKKNGQMMGFSELQKQMDEIISHRVRSDFRKMDNMIVQIYDRRQSSKYPIDPKPLGRMPLWVALQKFR